VRREVRPLLDESTKVWLDAATEPLGSLPAPSHDAARP
jgi:hypothetical protein